jgi:hypothetical protein
MVVVLAVVVEVVVLAVVVEVVALADRDKETKTSKTTVPTLVESFVERESC